MKHIAENTADKADFVISTGDLVEPSTEAAYRCASESCLARNRRLPCRDHNMSMWMV